MGASGLRVGALLSSNEEVLAPVRKLNDLCQVSSTTQQLVEKMLGDKEWVAGFLKENMRLVRRRYERVLEACNEAGIKYLECDGGLYVWLDLRPWMREGETEKDLGSRLIKEHGLLMTPGEMMRTGQDWSGFIDIDWSSYAIRNEATARRKRRNEES